MEGVRGCNHGPHAAPFLHCTVPHSTHHAPRPIGCQGFQSAGQRAPVRRSTGGGASSAIGGSSASSASSSPPLKPRKHAPVESSAPKPMNLSASRERLAPDAGTGAAAGAWYQLGWPQLPVLLASRWLEICAMCERGDVRWGWGGGAFEFHTRFAPAASSAARRVPPAGMAPTSRTASLPAHDAASAMPSSQRVREGCTRPPRGSSLTARVLVEPRREGGGADAEREEHHCAVWWRAKRWCKASLKSEGGACGWGRTSVRPHVRRRAFVGNALLLRAFVGRRAPQVPPHLRRRPRRRPGLSRVAVGGTAREPKVDQLTAKAGAASSGNHHVLPLEVVVHDPMLVHVRQRTCHLFGHLAQLIVWRRIRDNAFLHKCFKPGDDVLLAGELECKHAVSPSVGRDIVCRIQHVQWIGMFDRLFLRANNPYLFHERPRLREGGAVDSVLVEGQ
eukprot:scaffold1728_cov53-Phaeocystis_antarctica.AAC.2